MLDARAHPRVFGDYLQRGDFSAGADAKRAGHRCRLRAVEDVERAEITGGTGCAGGGEDEGVGVIVERTQAGAYAILAYFFTRQIRS